MRVFVRSDYLAGELSRRSMPGIDSPDQEKHFGVWRVKISAVVVELCLVIVCLWRFTV